MTTERMPIDEAQAVVDHFIDRKSILDLPSGGWRRLDEDYVREAVRVYRAAFGPRDLSVEDVAEYMRQMQRLADRVALRDRVGACQGHEGAVR